MDGVPKKLMEGTGFPYVLTRTPEVREDRVTMEKYESICTMIIQVVSKRESVARSLADEVRGLLKDNINTTKANHLFNFVGDRVTNSTNKIK